MNFALKPERKSIGQLSYVNLDDQSIEQFGAAKMKDLGWGMHHGRVRLHPMFPLSGGSPRV
ncbi:MAG: hypothetical protein U0X93_04160 [Anaerolineales bacterium]